MPEDGQTEATTEPPHGNRVSGSSVRGVASDMDGTLIDTAGHGKVSWAEANKLAVEAYGAELRPGDLDGLPDGATAADVAVKLVAAVRRDAPSREPTVPQMKATNDRAMADLVSEHGVRLMPGALPLLDVLARANVPVALVTASSTSVVDAVLGQVPELGRGTFPGGIVTSDTVERTKPDPEPYRHAAQVNGWPETHVVALEDSQTGVASAKAAGMQVIQHTGGDGAIRTKHGHMHVPSWEGIGSDHVRYFGALNPADAPALRRPGTDAAALTAVTQTAPTPHALFLPTRGLPLPARRRASATGPTPAPLHLCKAPKRDHLRAVAREIGLG